MTVEVVDLGGGLDHDCQPDEMLPRWSPCGKYVVDFCPERLQYHTGGACMLSAETSESVVDFEVNCHRLWPKWMPLSSDDSSFTPLPSSQAAGTASGAVEWACFLPNRQQLTSLQSVESEGDAVDVYADSPSQWTQVSGVTSPRCRGIIVTLLVKDGRRVSLADSACRQPRTLDTPIGLPEHFLHKRLGCVSGHAASGYITIHCQERHAFHKASLTMPLQGHPFVMAWLHGTDTYAAAAFGCIWLNDAYHDVRLACWRANDQNLTPVHSLGPIGRGRPGEFSFDQGEPRGCVAMAFSPDCSCLAWMESDTWAIISFADFVSEINAIHPADVPLFQPCMNHLAGQRCVHPVSS